MGYSPLGSWRPCVYPSLTYKQYYLINPKIRQYIYRKKEINKCNYFGLAQPQSLSLVNSHLMHFHTEILKKHYILANIKEQILANKGATIDLALIKPPF